MQTPRAASTRAGELPAPPLHSTSADSLDLVRLSIDNLDVAGRTVELNLPITRADGFRRAEEALIIAGGMINFRDLAAGRIAATVPMSFKSFGESVEVDISGSDGDVRVYKQTSDDTV